MLKELCLSRDRTRGGNANVFPHPAARQRGDARPSSCGQAGLGVGSAERRGCSLVGGTRDLEDWFAKRGEGGDGKPD
jgi:hypothetical protein